MDVETRQMIKRLCDCVLNHPSVSPELDMLALLIGHHPAILNPNDLKPLTERGIHYAKTT